jgi:hypothetical protein
VSNKENVKNGMPHRGFAGAGTAAVAGFTVIPRSVLGGPGYTAPSDMVNVAGISGKS